VPHQPPPLPHPTRGPIDPDRPGLLIGRAAQLEQLDSLLGRTLEGQTIAVIVGGEAGVGKSRLVDAFGEHARAADCHVLTGHCLDLGERGAPYAPFVEALRSLVRSTPPGALPALLGPGRTELSRLLPELDSRGAVPETVGDTWRTGQTRLFELFLGMLERLARERPLVMVIEDLHWADQSTRDLLSFLLHVTREAPVLFVITARSDELHLQHPVLAYLAELERLANVDRIELLPLSREDIGMQVRAIAGPGVSEAQIDAIAERTNGNPFFVEQVLAAHAEALGDIPPRLHDVLLGRIARLSPDAQELLRAASAAGSEVDDELLAAVLELPPREHRDSLRELIDRQVLVPVRGDLRRGRYQFRHDLLKEVVYQQLFPGERRRLHAGYARVLADRLAAPGLDARTAVATPGELAYHWDAAGDYARALPAAIAAGDAADRVYAFADALANYERALAIWDLVPDPAGLVAADRATVLERAAEAAVSSGSYERAVTLGTDALSALPPDADIARRAWLHERLRWYLFESGDRAGAELELRQAERLVPREPPTGARAVITAHQAAIEMFAGHYLRSRALAQEALAIADACDVPAQRAIAVAIVGWDRAMLGDVDAGIALFRAALAEAEAGGRAEGVALGYSSLASLLDFVGRPDEVLELTRQGMEHAHRMGFVRTYGGLLLASRASALFLLGRWDEAAHALTEGLGRQPSGRSSVALNLQQARLEIGRGSFDDARRHTLEARSLDERLGGSGYRIGILAAEAELACWLGDVETCRRAVANALIDPPDGPPEPALCRLIATAVRAEADATDRARAHRDAAALSEAEARAGELSARLEQLGQDSRRAERSDPAVEAGIVATGALVVAELARARHVPDPDAWASAAARFDDLGWPLPAAYARFQQAAAVLAARGARDLAEASLRRAHDTATRLGALPIQREIELLARQARLTLDPRDAPDGHPIATAAPVSPAPFDGLGLTDREREVLRLVAGGWSNQQIADALFISPKTASVHVSNILGKLGVHTRVEAAALAHRVGGPGAELPMPPDATP
jgi:ATP/maltotriose-dependent transcriptional regulator MalT